MRAGPVEPVIRLQEDGVAEQETRDDDLVFSEKERETIRLEFMYRFGGARSVREGILLKRGAPGDRTGQVTVPAAVQSMIDRGMAILEDTGGVWATAHFTPKGYLALRRLLDRSTRRFPAEQYAQLREDVRAFTGASPER